MYSWLYLYCVLFMGPFHWGAHIIGPFCPNPCRALKPGPAFHIMFIILNIMIIINIFSIVLVLFLILLLILLLFLFISSSFLLYFLIPPCSCVCAIFDVVVFVIIICYFLLFPPLLFLLPYSTVHPNKKETCFISEISSLARKI